jgi:hypothetical protein
VCDGGGGRGRVRGGRRRIGGGVGHNRDGLGWLPRGEDLREEDEEESFFFTPHSTCNFKGALPCAVAQRWVV